MKEHLTQSSISQSPKEGCCMYQYFYAGLITTVIMFPDVAEMWICDPPGANFASLHLADLEISQCFSALKGSFILWNS